MQIPVCIRQRWRLHAERADKRGSSFPRTPALFWQERSECSQIPNSADSARLPSIMQRETNTLSHAANPSHASRSFFLFLSHKTTRNSHDRSVLILFYLCLQPPFLLYLIHSCVGVWTFHNSIHLSQKPNLAPLKGSVCVLTQYDSKTLNHKLLFMLSL